MDTLLTELMEMAKLKGLTQAELAEKSGIHPVTLSRAITSGNCRLSTVHALARCLGMKIIAIQDNDLAKGLAKGNLF